MGKGSGGKICFVDCILAGYYETENTAIQTFDTKLEKLLTIIANMHK